LSATGIGASANSRPELSVIVLCYRAGRSIGIVIEPLYAQLQELAVAFELVLVANYWPGQNDPTPSVVSEFAESRAEIRVISDEKQGAMGWDMRSGLEAASGDYLVVMDGDSQNPVDDAVKIYKQMKITSADVMKGRRVLRHDGSYRRFISLTYNLLFLVVFRTFGLWDINGKPKALTRRAYSDMQLESDDWFIDAEIVLAARSAGLRIVEMPVVFLENPERSSFVKISAIWEFIKNMARYRTRRPGRR
jgi:glycosyltransferase involved in cell wall biosynthesis